MGSLQTYQMNVLKKDENKKGKSIAFIVEETESGSASDELEEESLALLTRNFSKILKRITQRNGARGSRPQNNWSNQSDNTKPGQNNFRPRQSRSSNRTNPQGSFTSNLKNKTRTTSNTKMPKSKGIKCRECEGYGHI